MYTHFVITCVLVKWSPLFQLVTLSYAFIENVAQHV